MEFTYDVAVIGGGVAGICAAIAAAKGGAKTVLIERNAVVGGMSTSGFVNVWCGRTGHQFFKDICSEETLKKGIINSLKLHSMFLIQKQLSFC